MLHPASRTLVASLVSPARVRSKSSIDLNYADLGNRHTRIAHLYPLGNAKAWGIAMLGLKRWIAFFFRSVFHPPKEVQEGTLEIMQRLLERLALHLAQPCGVALLFQPSQFDTQIVKPTCLADPLSLRWDYDS